MSWLMSYQSRYCQKYGHGTSINAPVDTIEVISEHPAQWLIGQLAKSQALEEAEFDARLGPQTAYLIERIYSAIEVPDEDIAARLLNMMA